MNEPQDAPLEKLRRKQGYRGCRIRPMLSHSAVFLAEVYTPSVGDAKSRWRPLEEDESGSFTVRTFVTPEEACEALIAWRGRSFSE
ncbi:MAG TPA: hypothetical protein VKR06_22140, partial [Ktedonosporobacter sp.]|nr:hypothetical protein [Ktedonosporobacter sp.]